MTLKPGTMLGHYEILGLIGKGGMGEVYRAHDHKLARDVALKLLPEQFARDPDRVARFRREARLLASLNHSNIAAIYGVEDFGDTHFLVMELVEGDTLAEQLHPSRDREGAGLWKPSATSTAPRGLPIEETLRIATQIAEALEHAHDKAIIHRDLKPANVKITPEGKVKVLDFGLAKAFASDSSDQSDGFDSQSPTVLTASPTLPGVILGTAAYMSPEQAKGKTVDKRADIWAFGCVLYELLTGRQAFTGESVPEILGSIFKSEPDWSLLPEATPPAIRTLLRRCLRKDAQQRARDAGDIRIEIDEARATSSSVIQTVALGPESGNKLRERLAWAVAGVAVVAAFALAIFHFRPVSTSGSVTRFAINLPPNERLVAAGYCQALALSPDGTHLAYVTIEPGAIKRLRLRVLDSLEVQTIPGIYQHVDSLFFSPDGQWLGFWADGALKKVSVSGGTPVILANAGVCGASWGINDTIVFGTDKGLEEVSAAGGPTKLLAAVDPKKEERGYFFPEYLPGGRAVLFTVWSGIPGPPWAWVEDDHQIVVQSLETGQRRTIIQGAGAAHYVSAGYLVYPLAGRLMAAPFNLAGLELQGKADTVFEGIIPRSGAFSVSRLGSLLYIPGPVEGSGRTLAWVDRQGKAQPFDAPARDYAEPNLSPDGQRLAVTIHGDIWVYDMVRGTLTRLTFDGFKTRPLFSPDGSRIAFGSFKNGAWSLSWIAADGSDGEETLTSSTSSEMSLLPMSWSPDGLWLAYVQTTPATKSDIWILPLQGERKPRLFLQTRFSDAAARFSPDGHWLVYRSDESGQNEVYARPFPGPGGKIQISTEGGRGPLWPRKGSELFFQNGDKMMVVDVPTQPTLRPGIPRLLFQEWYENDPGTRSYDVTPDGRRFLMLEASEQESAATQINVVLNWFEELKRRVPVP